MKGWKEGRMSLRNSAHWLGAVFALCAAVPAQAYQFSLDNFFVQRLDASTGGLIFSFNDPFTDGNAPPSAPNFSTGTPASYFVSGSSPPLGTEAGGKLILNGSDTQPTIINAADFTIELATLLTNIAPASTLGLRQGSLISVTGIFDLAAPSLPNQYYGIRLLDGTAASNGDDDVRVIVRRTLAGDVAVQLWDVDLTALTIAVLSSDVLTAAELLNPQIQLALNVNELGDVAGSYSLDGGLTFTLLPAATIPSLFHGETFTRAGFLVVSPVPIPGTLWLVALALGALGIVGRRSASSGRNFTV